MRLGVTTVLVVAGVCFASSSAFGAESATQSITRGLDTLWVLLAAFLVFLMQAGFGMVEAGFIRAKNTCNILMKNFLDFCMSSLGFFAFGYAIMFGAGNSLFGREGWFLSGAKSAADDLPLHAFWLFQAVFCGAAATIVAGGLAERLRFRAYLIYSFLISALVYPIVGHWVWSAEGWLAKLDFADFAGSTVVHATGGWAAFIGALMLGPRNGKYKEDGSANAIAGHSIPLASLGVFLLWFGWFGFNPGSTLAVGDGSAIARVAINTNLAAASGAIVAMFVVWGKYGKPDLSMTMNGALAGLVAVTAPCRYVSPSAAIVIGAFAGVIVVCGVAWLDKLHIDDPVGAVPVHGMNGIWGTLAVGIFGRQAEGLAHNGLLHGGGLTQLGIQALGALSVTLFVIAAMALVFKLIDVLVGLRVSLDEELKGLDICEHGMESYAGFQVFVTH